MAEAEPKPDAAPPVPPAPSRGGKAVPLLLAVNTAALLALVGVQVLSLRAARHAPAPAAPAAAAGSPEKHEGPERPGPIVRLADFVVHLRDTDSDRYARVSFELELGSEKDKEGLAARTPQIRDAFLAYLSDRTAEQLRGSDAISRVTGTLTETLAEIAPGVPVRKLFVTELIVQ